MVPKSDNALIPVEVVVTLTLAHARKQGTDASIGIAAEVLEYATLSKLFKSEVTQLVLQHHDH